VIEQTQALGEDDPLILKTPHVWGPIFGIRENNASSFVHISA